MVFGLARFVFGEIMMIALPSLERPLCISETFHLAEFRWFIIL